MLEGVLGLRGAHARARASDVILLCLESRDPDAAAFGAALAARFGGAFFRVLYSVPPTGRPDEVPGKSANDNWGVRSAVGALTAELGAAAVDRAVVTVCDCDARVCAACCTRQQ